VVLSACNTGRGRITDGEDVVGFARALLAAGVKHVVVSLWPVDDEATCYLMEQFYENLMQSMPVAEALRAAQATVQDSKEEEIKTYLQNRGVRLAPQVERDVVKDYSHPKFWAPFVLIGA
jgi:CHAT domain-containing protein